MFAQVLKTGNPYHDAAGLFTSKDKASGTIVDKQGKSWRVEYRENTYPTDSRYGPPDARTKPEAFFSI